jgi:hypothetical protein
MARTACDHYADDMESTTATDGAHAMQDASHADRSTPSYELRFKSLFDEGRAYSFPCDVAGRVDMDTLSERARNNYLYARAVVGRELSVPAVHRTQTH